MAQQVKIAGALFNDVPYIQCPDVNDVYHSFFDTTIASNAATAADITSGKLAYVNGALVTGSATAPVLTTKSITANGTYNASSDSADGYSSVTVNVSGGGGGGLVYEAGTWTPSSNIADYTIQFANTHTTAPFFYMITDSGTDYYSTTYTNYLFCMFSPYLFCGALLNYDGNNSYYAIGHARYRTTSASSISNTSVTPTSTSQLDNWMTSTGIRAYTNSASRYWRSTRTYKWIAVWKPTS